ncbi:MAG: ankyrin repeat domain-containing protein [Methylomonas sp.]
MNATFSAIDSWLQAHASGADNTPAIILAARQGRADVLGYFIAQGEAIDQLDQYGNNALWAACYAEAGDCIDLLLRAGMDIDYQNCAGSTALMYASSAGKTGVVSQLIQAGADAELRNQDDFSALDLAANRECLQLLRKLQKVKKSI